MEREKDTDENRLKLLLLFLFCSFYVVCIFSLFFVCYFVVWKPKDRAEKKKFDVSIDKSIFFFCVYTVRVLCFHRPKEGEADPRERRSKQTLCKVFDYGVH